MAPILEEPKAFMGISNSKNCAFGCNQTDYPEFFFLCKMISTIWEHMEEKVYHKFEIKLKLTVNDVLFGYKGHSQLYNEHVNAKRWMYFNGSLICVSRDKMF